MLHLIWIVSIHKQDFLHRYMPTNIMLNAIRERHEVVYSSNAPGHPGSHCWEHHLCFSSTEGQLNGSTC